MNIEIDLSKIDDDTLADLANMCSRLEEEFQDNPAELETLFQQMGDVLRTEAVLRQVGGASKGLQSYELLDKGLFNPPALLAIKNIVDRWASMDTPHHFLGVALFRSFVL